MEDPFGEMGHGAPEAEKLPRAWTRVRRDRELPKSERRKESVAGLGRMRGQVS